MKKLTIIFSIVAFVLASCSKNDDSLVPGTVTVSTDNNTNSTGKLIKKIEKNGMLEAQFEYNGYKLAKATNIVANQYEIYTYEGNLIKNIEVYDRGTNILTSKRDFIYDANNRLINHTKTFISSASNTYTVQWIKDVFVYNNDGSITFTKNQKKVLESNITITANGVVRLGTNGEIAEKIHTENPGQTNAFTFTMSCNYDSKNSPFKNIVGFDKLVLLDENYLFGEYGRINNLKDVNLVFTSPSNQTSTLINVFAYDNEGYPVSCRTSISTGGNANNLVYTY